MDHFRGTYVRTFTQYRSSSYPRGGRKIKKTFEFTSFLEGRRGTPSPGSEPDIDLSEILKWYVTVPEILQKGEKLKIDDIPEVVRACRSVIRNIYPLIEQRMKNYRPEANINQKISSPPSVLSEFMPFGGEQAKGKIFFPKKRDSSWHVSTADQKCPFTPPPVWKVDCGWAIWEDGGFEMDETLFGKDKTLIGSFTIKHILKFSGDEEDIEIVHLTPRTALLVGRLVDLINPCLLSFPLYPHRVVSEANLG